MDLSLTDEQRSLRDAVRAFCAEHATPEIVRAAEDDPLGHRPESWRALARMDLIGLAIPEAYGGAGQGAIETAVLYEELGRSLLPSPHLATAVACAGLLLAAGSEEQRRAWLPRVVAGDAVLALAWLEPGRGEGPDGVQVRVERGSDGARLVGEKHLVAYASAATRLLVLARTGDAAADVGLYLADPAGAEITPTATLGSEPVGLVRFDGTPAEPVGTGEGGWAAFDEVMVDVLIAAGAAAVGGADRAHEMAVSYAKERVQFGKPIGAFQAIAHPLAETATEIAGARGLVHEAAWARARGLAAAPLAAMAKLYACDVYRRTTKLGQQVYGGIGFTRDIDMQLYFRRAKQLELSWWGPRTLEERIAAAELDAPEPFVTVDGLT